MIQNPKRIILDIPLLAYAFVLLLSFLFSSDKPASVFGSYGRWYDGFLAFIIFLLASRILAENLQLPRRIPFFEQGAGRWLLLCLPLLFLAGSLFFRSGPSWSYGAGFAVAQDTLFESPKNFLLGSGPGTFFIDRALYVPLERAHRGAVYGKDAAAPWFGELLATTGVLGTGLFIVVVGVLLYGAITLFQKRKEKTLASFVFGIAMTSTGVFFLLPMSLIPLLLFWGSLACSMAFLKGEKRYDLKHKALQFCIPAFGLLLVAGMLSGFFMVGAGEWWARRALLSADRLQYLQNAVQFHPFEPAYRIELSRAYLETFLEESLKPSSLQKPELLTENIQLASESARKAIRLAPNRAAAWETLGAIYKEIQSVSGAADFAVESFEKAVALDPANPGIRTQLGKTYAALHDSEKAREQFREALLLDPFFATALVETALLLEKDGNIDEALALMEQTALRSPDEFVLVQLGRMYYNTKRYSDAIRQFERALVYKETNSDARYALALSYEAIGDRERAIQELEKVLQLNPDSKELKQKLHQLQQKTHSLQ